MYFLKMREKTIAGFSLLELMVVVAIIGVLATFAVPRYNIFRARARQSEARSNLGVIFTLQESHKIHHETYSDGNPGMNARTTPGTTSVGYNGAAGGGTNTLNKLGFRLANPERARYHYWVQQSSEDSFLAVAEAPSDLTDKRIFPGCAGDEPGTPACNLTATAYPAGTAEGDWFCLDEDRQIDNFRDIVEYCED